MCQIEGAKNHKQVFKSLLGHIFSISGITSIGILTYSPRKCLNIDI